MEKYTNTRPLRLKGARGSLGEDLFGNTEVVDGRQRVLFFYDLDELPRRVVPVEHSVMGRQAVAVSVSDGKKLPVDGCYPGECAGSVRDQDIRMSRIVHKVEIDAFAGGSQDILEASFLGAVGEGEVEANAVFHEDPFSLVLVGLLVVRSG